MSTTIRRGQILGCALDLCDYTTAVDLVRDMVDRGVPKQIVTLNPEMIQAAQKDFAFMQLINHAALVTPDGVSVVWAAQKAGYPLKNRVTGIDLTLQICQQAVPEGWRIYLLGSAPGVAEKAQVNLQQRYPGLKVCGCHDGYFKSEEEPMLLAEIDAAQPDILLVGMGSPRQEFWIDKNKPVYQAAVSIGIGGSLDVIAGVKKRAPQWMMKLKIEWLYRLITEPARIKRQAALPGFVLSVLKSRKQV